MVKVGRSSGLGKGSKAKWSAAAVVPAEAQPPSVEEAQAAITIYRLYAESLEAYIYNAVRGFHPDFVASYGAREYFARMQRLCEGARLARHHDEQADGVHTTLSERACRVVDALEHARRYMGSMAYIAPELSREEVLSYAVERAMRWVQADVEGLGRITAEQWRGAIEQWRGVTSRRGRPKPGSRPRSWHAIVWSLLRDNGLTSTANSQALRRVVEAHLRRKNRRAAPPPNEA